MIDPNSIIVIGQTGQLALALRHSIPEALFFGRPEFDITDQKSFDTVPWEKAKYIINASAFTNVDLAETIEGRRSAWQVNAEGLSYLALIAKKYDCTLVHVSTDYVFDGTQSDHKETETPSPLNVYGQSKAAGEYIVRTLPKHYIVRAQWLIGQGNNFVQTMLSLGQKGIHPKVVSDQIGRLTFTNTLVAGIMHLLENNCDPGIYHLSNSGPVTSWANIAQKVFQLGHLTNTVTPVTTEEYFANKAESAKRPLLCSFDLSKINRAGFAPNNWEVELNNYMNQHPSITPA